jgi:hypothetical protein
VIIQNTPLIEPIWIGDAFGNTTPYTDCVALHISGQHHPLFVDDLLAAHVAVRPWLTVELISAGYCFSASENTQDYIEKVCFERPDRTRRITDPVHHFDVLIGLCMIHPEQLRHVVLATESERERLALLSELLVAGHTATSIEFYYKQVGRCF